MFTDDLSEVWDSSEFQDSFIKNYFGKGKAYKETANSELSRVDVGNFDFTTKDSRKAFKGFHGDSEHEVFCKPGVNGAKRILNSPVTDNVKKKKKLSNNPPEDKFIENQRNSSDETKLDSFAVDCSSLKSRKKKKRKSKHKNKIVEKEQTSNLQHFEIPKQMNSTKELQTEKEETDSISNTSLRKMNLFQNKFQQKLQGAKFRYLNEMLYTNTGKDALSYFQDNKDEFQDYHQGYQSQVSKWPINPVDVIIKELQVNKQNIIADLGCGEAKIAEAFPERTVHSFDLIALKDCVTACDMANVPLPSKSVDVVVFCLSLMGTNWKDYLKEGHRLLKFGAELKIAEIESRIDDLKDFIKTIEAHGFTLINKDMSHKMFVFLIFKKVKNKVKTSQIPNVTLKPCLYKRR